jgi:hypothetical protein
VEKNQRQCDILNTQTGKWEPAEFEAIKRGSVFRLFDPPGPGRVEFGVPNLALADATKTSEGVGTVNCEQLNWTGDDSPTPVDFATVIRELKAFPGKKFRRSGWNGKGMWIALQKPDVNSKMTLPYIYMKTVGDYLIPWLASQTDILAEDFEEVTEP